VSGYGRGGYRSRGRRPASGRTGGRGSRWMDLRYTGVCKVCGVDVPAGGRAFYDAAAKTVTCAKRECALADGVATVTDISQWNPLGTVKPLNTRIGNPAPIEHGRPSDPFAKTRSRGYYGIDAGRCEDAPCCGCGGVCG
jgi:hypothetical protein